MLSPGFYAVHRNTVLTLGSQRAALRKHDWLVTDGEHLGRFDKADAVDWVPLVWGGGQPIVLDEDLAAQVEAVAVAASFSHLERKLQQELDTDDGSPVPDMPRPRINGLGSYLRSSRTLLAYTYER
jgi:hypothetical protein